MDLDLFEQLVLVVHVIAALAVIGLVLIQQGKGADMGAAFGSGASNTMFGSVGSISFFAKLTAAIAVVFFATSITLGVMVAKQAKRASESSMVIPQEQVPPQLPQQSEPVKDGWTRRRSHFYAQVVELVDTLP